MIKDLKIYLFAMLLAVSLFACLDENLVSITEGPGTGVVDENKDMFLRVSVPRSASSGATADKETSVETLDMLVFSKIGADESADPLYYVKSACEGTIVEDEPNRFQVVMPVGEDFIVHVFVNCHDELVRQGFYQSAGREMEAMLGKLTIGCDVNTADGLLPMHGFRAGVTITKDDANKDIEVPLLRSVASVEAVTKATVSNTGGATVITPGTLTDAAGNVYFELRELYAYFQPDTARSAAATTNYAAETAETKNLTRDVTAPSLPAGDDFSVKEKEDKIFIKKPAATPLIGSLYLYENKPWSDNAFDTPGSVPGHPKAATTRLVVGGVYKGDSPADTTVTYYRIDFTEPADHNKLASVLRNHRYTFSIEDVAGPGYDNPDDAATGVPINIDVKVIAWTNEIDYVDFDRENYVYSETKSLVLPRHVGSKRSIAIESDVELGADWKLYFDKTSTVNGNAGVAEVSVAAGAASASIQNSRYKIDLTADNATKAVQSLTVTALKAYSDSAAITATPPTESYNDILYLKVKNLTVQYDLSQADRSPDDWGNGGELDTELGEDPNKPIEVGGLDFLIAPANLVGTKQADGTITYAFAEEQGWYSGQPDGGDYFCWNELDPTKYDIKQSSWDDARDPCRQLPGGKWHTPTTAQTQALAKAKHIQGTWTKADGTTVSGMYFGTDTKPTPAVQNTFVFLSYAGSRYNHGIMDEGGSVGHYWSNTRFGSEDAYELWMRNSYVSGGRDNYMSQKNGQSLRCVQDK